MKAVLYLAVLLFMSACEDGGASSETQERERFFKEQPVCTFVKPNVPCRLGKRFYPKGIDGPEPYEYPHEQYVPPERAVPLPDTISL